MIKTDEEQLSDFFVKAFKEVVLPVLEDHSEKLDSHSKQLTQIQKTVDLHSKQLAELQETVDSHTAALHSLEEIHGALKDITSDYKDTKKKLNDHEGRITRIEESSLHG